MVCMEGQQECWAKANCRQGCKSCTLRKQRCSLIWGAAVMIGRPSEGADHLVDVQERSMDILEQVVMALEALTSSILRQEGHTFLAAATG
jgi:hypothetical protein